MADLENYLNDLILMSENIEEILSTFSSDDDTVIVNNLQTLESILGCGGNIAESMISPFQGEFHDANGVFVIMSLLKSKCENLLIRKQCLALLRISARAEQNRIAIATSQDYVAQIVKYVRDKTDDKCQELACGCLRNLALTADFCDVVADAGGLEAIMDMIQFTVSQMVDPVNTINEPPSTVFAMGCLYVLTLNRIANLNKLCEIPQAVEVLISLLKHSKNSATVELVVGLFSSMCSAGSQIDTMNSDVEMASAMVDYLSILGFAFDFHAVGGLQMCREVFVRAEVPCNIKLRCCDVFSSLLNLLYDQMLDENMVAFFLHAALSPITDTDPMELSLRQNLFSLASNLIKKQEGASKGILASRAQEQGEIVRLIISALHDRHSSHIQPWLHELFLLLQLLIASHYNNDAAREANIFNLLSSILDEDESLNLCVCALIWGMSDTAESQVVIGEIGLLEKLMFLISTSDNAVLDENCLGTLTHAVLQKPNQEKLLKLNVFELFGRKLSQYAEQNTRINFLILTVLLNMVLLENDCKEACFIEVDCLREVLARLEVRCGCYDTEIRVAAVTILWHLSDAAPTFYNFVTEHKFLRTLVSLIIDTDVKIKINEKACRIFDRLVPLLQVADIDTLRENLIVERLEEMSQFPNALSIWKVLIERLKLLIK
jgi:hypothetical protein